jgi:hypothetical protein
VPDDAGHALVSGVEVVVPLKELKARLAKNEESQARLGRGGGSRGLNAALQAQGRGMNALCKAAGLITSL